MNGRLLALSISIFALSASMVQAQQATDTTPKLSPSQQIMQDYQGQLTKMSQQRAAFDAQVAASHRPGQRGSILRQTEQARQEKLMGAQGQRNPYQQGGLNGQQQGIPGQASQQDPASNFGTYAQGMDGYKSQQGTSQGMGQHYTLGQNNGTLSPNQGPPYTDGYFGR
jgi:hypothetical protein